MTTRVYGASDDLVEIEGDINTEVACYGTVHTQRGVLLVCSDGTALEAKFGIGGWRLKLMREGQLFRRLTEDGAHFSDGLKWIYSAWIWDQEDGRSCWREHATDC